MKNRLLKIEDVDRYKDDIFQCYQDCKLILDNQSPIDLSTPDKCAGFIAGFINSTDSIVQGIFDEKESFLYGLVIFDNIRIGKTKSCAEVHIVNSRNIWGKRIRDVHENILFYCYFDTLYCQIPTIATSAIALCKRLGFKKTGYIPNALPYTNCKGEEDLYDIQIYTYRKE